MISGFINEIDFLKAQLLHKKLTPKKRVLIFTFYSVIILIGIAALYMNSEFIGYLLIFGSIGNYLFSISIERYIFQNQVKKLFSQQTDFKYQLNYKWDEEYINALSSTGNSKRKWSNYLKIKENENIILLYHNDLMFEIFPVKWFLSEEQLNEFKKYATKNIKG